VALRLLALVLCLAGAPPAWAQRPDSARADTTRPVRPFRTGDLVVIPDSARADSLRLDTARTVAGRSLREPVKFSARDRLSLRFDSAGVGDVAALTGDARLEYGGQTLEAHTVTLLLEQDEVRARGLPVDTGVVGRPRFAQGEEQVVGAEIAYNLRTERGRFLGARTRLDDGFVRAAVVKVAPDSTVFARDAVYTTCPCVEDPSYSLRAGRMKIVDGKRVYTGPVQLYLFNIPMPLALPFGFLPATEGRRAGPLAPTYGEDERGFYLRNLGWYFPISDYLDLQVTGGLWSRGSWELTTRTRYARRYRYSGSLELSEGRSRYGEREDPGFLVSRARAVRWQHAQTLGPNTNLNANVNLATSDYLQSRSEALQDRVTQDIRSTVNYSTRWPRAGRSLSLTANQTQSLVTGAASLALPSASFSQNERRPFARRGVTGGRARWYETISYSYRATLDNRYDFRPLDRATLLRRGDTLLAARVDSISWTEALFSPSQYRLATGVTSGTPFALTARHDVPISATFDVRGLPFFPGFRANVVPNVTYTEQWFNQTERRVARDTTGVDVLRRTGFFALRQASATLSANTVFYGLFPLRVGAFDGLRHTVRPSLGVTFAPDYTGAPFNYFRSVTYTDPATRQVRTDRYAVVPGVAEVRQAALQFSLDNVFETRRVRTDTAGLVTRTPFTLLNLSATGAYNAAADSFRLSPLSLSASTSLFGRLDVVASASVSPYRLRDSTTLSPAYDFSFDPVPFGRLASFTIAASTQFSGGRRGDPRPSQRAAFASGAGFDALVPGAATGLPQGGFPGAGPFSPAIGAAPYADFSIPWSIAFDASYQYGRPFLVASRAFIVNTRFDANLTPRWKLQGTSGFDVTGGRLSTTSLSVLRDFDCWEMSLSWVPFGAYRSYAFNLQVKSGKLRELLRIQQPRQDPRRRLEGLVR
jgi:hypothetical protein